ncbi:MAG: hypothetical protein CM15mP18_1150 [Methanobacteriota archaeon]|nr:MAG: hypothetical protein CM15mP18_1150 [Euryarchaeota archaeon]
MTDQDPLDLLYESVPAQRPLLTGYGGNDKVNPGKFAEAQDPSTSPFPPTVSQPRTPVWPNTWTFHQHGMTTMLVTNGTLPKGLEKLGTLPTQLYVSVGAPNNGLRRRVSAQNGTAGRGIIREDHFSPLDPHRLPSHPEGGQHEREPHP